MAARKTHSDAQREVRLIKVAEMYVRGAWQAEIAKVCGVDQSMISRDLKVLQNRWRNDNAQDIDSKKARELAKLDETEREAWAAWERSKAPREMSSAEQSSGKETRNRTQLRKENRDGNPAYLNIVLQCINKRCEILGLNAPQKYDVRVEVERVAVEMGLPKDDVVREFNEILKACANA